HYQHVIAIEKDRTNNFASSNQNVAGISNSKNDINALYNQEEVSK
ncbi:11735_t:CDS:1, partial [Dentiscutata heterogama]